MSTSDILFYCFVVLALFGIGPIYIPFEILFYCFVSWLIILVCIIAGECVADKIIKMMEKDIDYAVDSDDLEY